MVRRYFDEDDEDYSRSIRGEYLIKLNNVEPHKTEIVQRVFRENYRDFKIYRFLNRMKWALPFVFIMGGYYVGRISMGGPYKVFLVSFLVAFVIVTLGYLDKKYIGHRFQKMLRILSEEHSINLSLEELLDVCKDILPK